MAPKERHLARPLACQHLGDEQAQLAIACSRQQLALKYCTSGIWQWYALRQARGNIVRATIGRVLLQGQHGWHELPSL